MGWSGRAGAGRSSAVVLLVALAGAAAGCSSSSSSHRASSGPPTSAHAATTVAPPSSSTTTTRQAAPTTTSTAASNRSSTCTASQLTGSIEGTSGAAGQFEVTVALKNTSNGPCTTGGYAGLQLVSTSGAKLQTTALRGGTLNFENIAPTPITLGPGSTAWFNLGYSDVPSGGETSCPMSSQLQIIPPNATSHLAVALRIDPCDNGAVHESPLFAAGSTATETTAPPQG